MRNRFPDVSENVVVPFRADVQQYHTDTIKKISSSIPFQYTVDNVGWRSVAFDLEWFGVARGDSWLILGRGLIFLCTVIFLKLHHK